MPRLVYCRIPEDSVSSKMEAESSISLHSMPRDKNSSSPNRLVQLLPSWKFVNISEIIQTTSIALCVTIRPGVQATMHILNMEAFADARPKQLFTILKNRPQSGWQRTFETSTENAYGMITRETKIQVLRWHGERTTFANFYQSGTNWWSRYATTRSKYL